MTVQFEPSSVALPPYEPPRSRHVGLFVGIGVVLVFLLAAGILVGLPARRDASTYTDAWDAYVAGDCKDAIEIVDKMIDSFRLLDATRRVADAKQLRAACEEFVSIEEQEPPEALLTYLGIVQSQPSSPLREAAVSEARTLVESADPAALATTVTCDDLGALGDAGLLEGVDADSLRAACITSYDEVVRTHDAVQVAVGLLRDGADEPYATQAVDYLVSHVEGCSELVGLGTGIPAIGDGERSRCLQLLDTSHEETAAYDLARVILAKPYASGAALVAEVIAGADEACFDRDSLLDLPGLRTATDSVRELLGRCIEEASSGSDTAEVAALRLEYIIRMANDEGIGLQRFAFVTDPASCDLVDRVEAEPTLRSDVGFLAELYFTCAPVEEFLGNPARAAQRYESFLLVAPQDARVPIVEQGLARALVTVAAQTLAGPLPMPVATGKSGSRRAVVTIYNTSAHDVRIAVNKDDAVVLLLPACTTCLDGAVATPPPCRADAPSVKIELAAGDYPVVAQLTDLETLYQATWTVERGKAYDLCFAAGTSG